MILVTRALLHLPKDGIGEGISTFFVVLDDCLAVNNSFHLFLAKFMQDLSLCFHVSYKGE